MWKLNGCPRCKGDLLIYQNEYGGIENCLQCGYVKYLEDENAYSESVNKEVSIPTLVRQDGSTVW
jgi:DNA-directed RNA polymerase subunit M/transcription elongation factor TFIIS